MLDHLRSTGDEVQKADVAKRVGELAERFAPDTQWFIDTMNQARPGVCCRYVQDAHR
jgi:AP-4 complex subunit epsilon-1